jgi:hypothetical protein
MVKPYRIDVRPGNVDEVLDELTCKIKEEAIEWFDRSASLNDCVAVASVHTRAWAEELGQSAAQLAMARAIAGSEKNDDPNVLTRKQKDHGLLVLDKTEEMIMSHMTNVFSLTREAYVSLINEPGKVQEMRDAVTMHKVSDDTPLPTRHSDQADVVLPDADEEGHSPDEVMSTILAQLADDDTRSKVVEDSLKHGSGYGIARLMLKAGVEPPQRVLDKAEPGSHMWEVKQALKTIKLEQHMAQATGDDDNE